MATLTGKTPAQTYKDLLQVSNSNAGIDSTLRTIEDGEGTTSSAKISTNKFQVRPASNQVDSFEVVNSSGTVIARVDTTNQIIEAVNGKFKGDASLMTGFTTVGTVGGTSSTTQLEITSDSDANGSTGTDDIVFKVGAKEIFRVPNSERSGTAIGATPYLKRKHVNWLNANGFGTYTDDLMIPHQTLTNNYAIMDVNGNYHWMVEIPRKNWDPTNTFASADIHPAFMVNGVQKRIMVGKYQLSQNSSSQYVTHAGKNVKHSLSFDGFMTAINALNGSGITGFHMVTNAEWSLIALLCKYYSQMPYGNNNYGRDIDDKAVTGQFESGSTAVFGSSSGNGARWLAGSGGILTSHNRQADGIFDLNGNVWEWNGGLRLVGGEIQILENNNAADYTKDQGASSTEWKAILADGTLVAPGTAGTLKVNASGNIDITTGVVAASKTFESVTTAQTGAGIDLLKKLAIMPYTTGLGGDIFYYNTDLERMSVRGGNWSSAADAGVFALYLHNLRSFVNNSIGSRAAFVL